MATERFTKEEFEKALPEHRETGAALWRPLGLVQGEYSYEVSVPNTNKRIVIRSSVKGNGRAASTGQDSIRHWVEYWYKDQWRPLSKGRKAYTTRVPGWAERMRETLRKLWVLAVNDSKKAGKYGKEYDVHGEVDSTEAGGEDGSRADGVVADAVSSGEGTAAGSGAGDVEVDCVRSSDDEDSGVQGGNGDGDKSGARTALSEVSGGDGGDPFGFLGDEDGVSEDEGQEPEPLASVGGAAVEVVDLEGPTPNEGQQEAIDADFEVPLRVLAPPGSGKTFMLIRRYARLASEVNPNNIVMVTFNRDMADELLAKAKAMCPGIADTAAEEQITTIHALCYRMLRHDGDRRRVPKFWKMKRALQDIIEEVWTIAHYRPGWKEVMSFIDAAKFRGLDSDSDMQLFGHIRDQWDRPVGQELHLARLKFDEWLERNRFLTFSDMLYDVERKLAEDRKFREYWQERVRYVFIDEGQDTSAQAMRILTRLAKPQDNVTIVGDTDQLLYRFAGATPEANLYNGFEERYPNGKTVKLAVNYRSTQTIIETYTDLIVNNYGSNAPYDPKYLKHIEPMPGAPEGEPVTFEMYGDAVEEGAAIARQIRQMLDSGREPGDFFIGARTCAQTGYLEGPLVALGVPYINLVGSSFWGMKHVNEVVSYLRLAYDKSDSEAFEAVYRIASVDMVHPWGDNKGEYCHHRYLGKAFLQKCYDGDAGGPLYKWASRAARSRRSYQPGVRDLQMFVDRLTAVMASEGPAQSIRFIIEECYESYLRAEEGIVGEDAAENGKLDDLETVFEIAAQFDSTADFLEYVKGAAEAAEAAKQGTWEDHVVISTIHRLKGQERPVVFGMGFCEGRDKNGQPIGLLPHTYSMRPPAQRGVLPTGGMGRIEDERDIAYVLISRAQEECHLTGCATYRKARLHASRFVQEMGLV